MNIFFRTLLGISLLATSSFATELINCSGVEGGDSYQAVVVQSGSDITVKIYNISNIINKRSMVGRNGSGQKDQYSQVSQSKFKALLNSENSAIDSSDVLSLNYKPSECAINTTNEKIHCCPV